MFKKIISIALTLILAIITTACSNPLVETTCSTCGGTQEILCTICKGEGGMWLDSYLLPGEKTFSECLHCGGTGIETCPDCTAIYDGGYVDDGIVDNITGGDGYYPDINIGGDGYYPDLDIGGNSTCAHCGGKKVVPCTFCGGSGKYSYKSYQAPDFGYGGNNSYMIEENCKTCRGTGYVDCIYCY